MQFTDFWYVVAESRELQGQTVLSRQVLGEWLALFRDSRGHAIALQDRCIHRQGRLSCGSVRQGQLHCPYHGWVYGFQGAVTAIPAEGEQFRPRSALKAKAYLTQEQEGLIYVYLGADAAPQSQPFAIPFYQKPGWCHVRLMHCFANSVTNCVENFIDIPHTVSVHPGIFRVRQRRSIQMTVTRRAGTVEACYRNETANLGWWSPFLNPNQGLIEHYDRFFMPNITSVEYRFGPQRHLFITSQAVPETETLTRVYTDVTFHYGIWSWGAIPFVWWTAKRIIAQDVVILKMQGETIAKYGEQFTHSPVDTIHVFVESIRGAIAQGQDPRSLPDQSVEVTFWV